MTLKMLKAVVANMERSSTPDDANVYVQLEPGIFLELQEPVTFEQAQNKVLFNDFEIL
jgi:hypothetical protein